MRLYWNFVLAIFVWKMAFDFEKLEVYKKVKEYNSCMRKEFLVQDSIDKISKDQLRRASLSLLLNIAEGTSRFSNASKRNFFVIARGSLFETVALLDYLQTDGLIQKDKFELYYMKAEEISRMLYGMIRGLEKKV